MFEAVVTRDMSILEATRLMGATPGNKYIAGIAVVLNEKDQVIGLLTDGDVRRGLAEGKSLDSPVSDVANMTPFLLLDDADKSTQRRLALTEARRRGGMLALDKLVVVDDQRRLRSVQRLSDLVNEPIESRRIAVYGLGFVGLTLACTLANANLSVIGIERDKGVADQLEGGEPHFVEQGLDALLQVVLRDGSLTIMTVDQPRQDADVHIVCVGPTLDGETVDYANFRVACEHIRTDLAPGNVVIIRSTLPVGATREVALPILEESGLRGGIDFSLAFAPERTVEGNALEELRTLPQVIGGLTSACAQEAAKVFREITRSIVHMPSLEAAELVKLINNTYRDLVFSFSNEVAMICESLNLNAFDLIRAANDGYTRNPIPSPSPGVGGYCLPKDSLLYSIPRAGVAPSLGQAARAINSKGAELVLKKLEVFCARMDRDIASTRILVVGIAFKGWPSTSDTRMSVAVDFINLLPTRQNVRVLDHVVPHETLKALGVEVATGPDSAFHGINAVFFMNNHPLNNTFNITNAIKTANSPLLFFDGWSQFDSREIERIDGAHYATLGYLSP